MSLYRRALARCGEPLGRCSSLLLTACTVGSVGLAACGGAPATPAATPGTPVDPTPTTIADRADRTGPTGVSRPADTEATPTASSAPDGPTAGIDRDEPAAVVNGEPISFEELDTVLERRYGAQIMDQLVIERIIEQEARRRNITVGPEDIEAELERVRRSVPAGQDFEQAVVQQFGSLDAFREQVRLNLFVQKMLESGVRITDQQIRQYYDQNKQMFAPPEERRVLRVVTDTREQADAAARLLRENAPLQRVIEEHGSTQPERAEQSEDLGFAQVQTLPGEIAVAAATLKRDQVSDPIELPGGGFAVVKVAGIRGGQAPPLSEVRDRVRETLRDQQIGQLAQPFVQDLRARATVETQFDLPSSAQPPAQAPAQTPGPAETPQG